MLELAGLLYHMKTNADDRRKSLCSVYTNLNRDSGMCRSYPARHGESSNEIMSQEPDGIATGYSFEGQLLGHIIQGVKTTRQPGT